MFPASPEFQITVVLVAALFGFMLAAKLRQSGTVASILAGIIVGPSILGIVGPSETIEALAMIGAIFLLFVVGLDTRPEDLANAKAAAVAFLGVVLPWGGGYLVSRLFGFSGNASFFVGTCLTATSIAITVQVFKELGKISSPEAKIIIGAAVIDDILSLLALSVAEQVALAGGFSPLLLAGKALLALGFLAAAFLVGKMVITKWLVSLQEWAMLHRAYEPVPFIALVLFAFAYSLGAELAGLSAVVGAFVAGVALENVEIGERKEGVRYFEIIFGCLFFVSLGVTVNLKELFSSPLLVLFLLALTVVALATKFAAGFLASAGMSALGALGVSGSSRRLDARACAAVGLGMMPRGEIAMISALVGLGAGVIDNAVFSVVVAVGLLTTMIAPVALSHLYNEHSPRAPHVKIY